MATTNPQHIFPGKLLILAPHMDDEVLACGGTIAQLPQKERIQVVYATDGAMSPVPPGCLSDLPPEALPDIRIKEALEAMGRLGVPATNLHFWGFPDARLQDYAAPLRRRLGDLIDELQPDQLLVPFRYDRHPDHLALHRAALAVAEGLERPEIVEYFVYYRWQLLPGKDLRRFIPPEKLWPVDISGQAELKQQALQCYRSQTTCFYPWQTRAILPPARVEEVSRDPEIFLRYDTRQPGAAVFDRARTWIRLVHRLEPRLKVWKDRLLHRSRKNGVPDGSAA